MIHEEFNIPKKVIGRYLKVYNIPILTKYDRVIIKYKDKIIRDYINNKSLAEISEEYKILHESYLCFLIYLYILLLKNL
jgi:hypothetical protein